MSAAIAILAKAPVPGRVKTRLVPPLTPEEAAGVARACLDATLRRFVPAIEVPFTLFLDGEADHALVALASALGVAIEPQAEGDLGVRLSAAFRSLRDGGANTTIAIGSDSPTLDPARIVEAIAALDAHDVVIGPTEDGGYYLIGVRGDRDGIFEEIPWSTGEVLGVTLERARARGLVTHRLAPWYDVDDPTTLTRAIAEAKRPLITPGLAPAHRPESAP